MNWVRVISVGTRITLANPKYLFSVDLSKSHRQISLNLTVDASRNLWFRLFVPSTTTTSSSSLPVIVFFHGGDFSFLSPDSFAYDAVCRKFARTIPAVVVSVNYRLSPEHGYPSQYDNNLDVLKPRRPPRPCRPLPLLPRRRQHRAPRGSAGLPEEFQVVKPIGLVLIQPFFGSEERTVRDRTPGSVAGVNDPNRLASMEYPTTVV
ncbi:hypothetical protein ACLB2K_022953 [Fragaria x ananassa]